MKKITLLMVFAASVLINACNESDSAKGKQSATQSIKAVAAYKYKGSAASAAKLNSISEKASLREKLPKEIIAYVRYPSTWGFLSSPKGTVLDKALRDNAHVAVVNQLREGLFNNLLKGNGHSVKKGLAFLLYQMRAPLEVVVLPSLKGGSQQIPFAVIYTKAKFKTIKEASDALTTLAKEIPIINIATPMNASGRASLMFGRAPIAGMPDTRIPGFIDYSTTTGELFIGVGYEATKAAAARAQFKPGKHVMYDMELKIDQSARGYFVWVDVDNLLVELKPHVNPFMYRMFGMAQVRKAALGWGVHKGKSRMKIITDMPWDFPAYTSVMGKTMKLKASGNPSYFFGIAFPGPDHWDVYKTFLMGMPASRQRKEFESGLAIVKTKTGVSVDDLFKNLGPQVLLFGDKLGDYAAIQLRDPAKFDKMMQTIITTAKLKYRKYSAHGKTIHYLVVPQSRPSTKMLRHMPMYLRIMFRQNMHMYWTVEGNYIVLSGVPQMLKDRIPYPNKVEIGTWLKKNQKQDFTNAAWLGSFSTSGVSQTLYYSYLNMLQIMGDLIDTPVEVAKLPSFSELKMPVSGTYGFQLNLYKNRMSAELLFENNPLEILLNAKALVAVGVVGLAVALVPEIQLAQSKGNVSYGLSNAAQLQAKVTEFHIANKKFPDPAAMSEILAKINKNTSVSRISVEGVTGKITVRFTGDLQLWGRSIFLTPSVSEEGKVSWKCTSNLRYRYLPYRCQN